MDPGKVVLFGSGEISPTAQPIYDELMRGLGSPVRAAVLETPAGFQVNSADVAEEVARFLREHLPNYAPHATVVPARRRGTSASPDDPAILGPLLTADLTFLGPGSPSYAVRQLRDSLTWQVVTCLQRSGHPLVLASAATIAVSAWALPVYEIYKAGEDLHWIRGLDLWGAYGISLVFVPHWDNSEGGARHDTSRCFMGRSRFEELLGLLPPGATVVGIDEHTALCMDAGAARCDVRGRGAVTLSRGRCEERIAAGASFPMTLLGPLRLPEPEEGIPARVQELVSAAAREVEATRTPSEAVLGLVAKREAARGRQDWAAADCLRSEISARGWSVRDTRDGPVVELVV